MYWVSCWKARPVTNGAAVSTWTWIDAALGTRLITRTRVRMGSAPTPLPLLQLVSGANPMRQASTVSRRRTMIGISKVEVADARVGIQTDRLRDSMSALLQVLSICFGGRLGLWGPDQPCPRLGQADAAARGPEILP